VDITPRDEFQMDVEGAITKNSGNVIFRGSNAINVIRKLDTTKEEPDDLVNLNSEKVFSQFNPS
jgi:hypothetical protein